MCRRMEPEERIADLEDRIEQLEREQKSDTDMTRRDTLKTGAAALGLGGLIGGGASMAATEPASAGTDQTGTWGSPGNPQDFIAEDIYGPDGEGGSQAVAVPRIQGTDMQYNQARFGFEVPGRPETMDGDLTITIDDSDNIDWANYDNKIYQNFPVRVTGKVDIEISGDHSTEDVLLPYFIGGKRTTGSERQPVQVTGDTTTPSNVPIKSFYCEAPKGQHPVQIRGVETQGHIPTDLDDEQAAIGAYGGGELNAVSLKINNSQQTPKTGILAYNSPMTAWGVDMGTDIVQYGYLVKHMGVLVARENTGDNGISGTVGSTTDIAYNLPIGELYFADQTNTLSATNSLVNVGRGIVYGFEDNRDYSTEVMADLNLDDYLGIESVSVEPNTFTIQDDNVVSFEPTGPFGILVAPVAISASATVAHSFDSIAFGVSGDNTTNQGVTTLSGTTGTDNNVNLAKDGNILYIENRRGDTYDITFIDIYNE